MDASRDDPSSSEPPSGHAPWQYSLRGLLILTTIVSACLGIAVQFSGFQLALFVLFAFQVLVLASIIAAFGILCHRLLWILLNGPTAPEDSQPTEVPSL